MGKNILPDEVAHVAQALLTKGFQGAEDKRNLCLHLARIAVNAHHEWGDEARWKWAQAAVAAEKAATGDVRLYDDGGIDPPVLGEPE